MTLPKKLTEEEIRRRLPEIAGWDLIDEKLHRELVFADFSAAFGFMARLALAAEKQDHHPDWSNSWNRVTIDLVTHASGGVTDRDFRLASAANALLEGT